MTHRERFHAVMDFQPVDRLPVMEWAPWWKDTVARWEGEGLPEGLGGLDLQKHFGLDPIVQHRVNYAAKQPSKGVGAINSEADYEAFLRARPDPAAFADRARWEGLAREQQRGDLVIWLTFDGFFWYPRAMFGIERHLYAFYDQADLMRRMNADHVEYLLRVLDAVVAVYTPDFITFAEDMSYNHGPMLSKAIFDEFLRPCYLRVVPRLKELGIRVFVDSDGQVRDLLPWLLDVGVEGILPLERQAGCDVAAFRAAYPRLLMLGAYDKMVMNRGEAAIRAEFERLLPTVRSGGFIPSCDHQTPPGVSLADYRLYLRLFREYAAKV